MTVRGLAVVSIFLLACSNGGGDGPDLTPDDTVERHGDVRAREDGDGTPGPADGVSGQDAAPDVAAPLGTVTVTLDEGGSAQTDALVAGGLGGLATLPAGTMVVGEDGEALVGETALILEEPYAGFDDAPAGVSLVHQVRVGVEAGGTATGAYFSTWTEALLDDFEAEPPTGLTLRLAPDGLVPRSLALLYERVGVDPDAGDGFVPAAGEGVWRLAGKALTAEDSSATFQVRRTGAYAVGIAHLPEEEGRATLYDLVGYGEKEIVAVLAVEKSTAYVISAWTAPPPFWRQDFARPETSVWFHTGSPDEPFQVRLEDFGKVVRLRSEFANRADLKLIYRDGGVEWKSVKPCLVYEDGTQGPCYNNAYSDCDRRFATPIRVWVRSYCGKRKHHYKPRVLDPLREHYAPYVVSTRYFKKLGEGYFAELLVDADSCTNEPSQHMDLVQPVYPAVTAEEEEIRNGRALVWKTGCGIDENLDDCFVPTCESAECLNPARDCGCADLVKGDFGATSPVSCNHAKGSEQMLEMVGCNCRDECWFLGTCCADVLVVCDNEPVCDGAQTSLFGLVSEAEHPGVYADVSESCKPCHNDPLAYPEFCHCGLCNVASHPFNCWPEMCGCATDMDYALPNHELGYKDFCDRTGMVSIDGKNFSDLKAPGGCYCNENSVTTGYACPDICATCGYCPECGDGHCGRGLGENCANCPADCNPCTCGDYICQDGAETPETCPQDCYCGDSLCHAEAGESKETCIVDCHCGDGVCDAPNDNCFNCPADCGECG